MILQDGKFMQIGQEWIWYPYIFLFCMQTSKFRKMLSKTLILIHNISKIILHNHTTFHLCHCATLFSLTVWYRIYFFHLLNFLDSCTCINSARWNNSAGRKMFSKLIILQDGISVVGRTFFWKWNKLCCWIISYLRVTS